MKDKLIKVSVWRGISIGITLAVLYTWMGDVKSSTGITFFLHAFLTACHFAFENSWEVLYESGRSGEMHMATHNVEG